MKKKFFAVLLSLAALLTGCGASAPAPTAAPAEPLPAEKAQAAYQEILKAAPALTGEHPELEDASFGQEENLAKFGKHYDQFAIADLNGDGVPELIALTAVNFRWTTVSVYTWADGSAVLVKGDSAQGTFEQNSSANGAYVTYLCPDNHLHSVWSGTNPLDEQVTEGTAYTLDGTTLKTVDCAASEGTVTLKANTAN